MMRGCLLTNIAAELRDGIGVKRISAIYPGRRKNII